MPRILSTPPAGSKKQNLLLALQLYINRGKPCGPDVFAVHRLDRDTSGLLVFAKTPAAREQLIEQFKARKPEREYVAILKGLLEPDEARLEDRLFIDQYFNQKVSRKGRIGQIAILNYKVLRRSEDASLVSVWLETGRKNQIRAQFAERGHPVLGDDRYKKEAAKHPGWGHKRLALHAIKLGFLHPITAKLLQFETALPREFKNFF